MTAEAAQLAARRAVSGHSIIVDVDHPGLKPHRNIENAGPQTLERDIRTQVDGPTKAKHDEDRETNKTLVREYYETFHIAGQRDAIQRDAITQRPWRDRCIRHWPGVADGLGEFMRDAEVLTRDRTIDEIRLLLEQGDFVFLAA